MHWQDRDTTKDQTDTGTLHTSEQNDFVIHARTQICNHRYSQP